MTRSKKEQMEATDGDGNDPFMTASEARKILKLSTWGFYRLLNADKIPGAIKVGASWRIRKEKFWGWVHAKETDDVEEEGK